jgi:hypothetical protein
VTKKKKKKKSHDVNPYEAEKTTRDYLRTALATSCNFQDVKFNFGCPASPFVICWYDIIYFCEAKVNIDAKGMGEVRTNNYLLIRLQFCSFIKSYHH